MTAHDATAARVVAIARDLHTTLGHRLSDEAYQAALAFELRERGLSVEQAAPISLLHDGVELDMGYQADLLVTSAVVVRFCGLGRLDVPQERWLLERLALPGARAAVYLDFQRPVLDVLTIPTREPERA